MQAACLLAFPNRRQALTARRSACSCVGDVGATELDGETVGAGLAVADGGGDAVVLLGPEGTAVATVRVAAPEIQDAHPVVNTNTARYSKPLIDAVVSGTASDVDSLPWEVIGDADPGIVEKVWPPSVESCHAAVPITDVGVKHATGATAAKVTGSPAATVWLTG